MTSRQVNTIHRSRKSVKVWPLAINTIHTLTVAWSFKTPSSLASFYIFLCVFQIPRSSNNVLHSSTPNIFNWPYSYEMVKALVKILAYPTLHGLWYLQMCRHQGSSVTQTTHQLSPANIFRIYTGYRLLRPIRGWDLDILFSRVSSIYTKPSRQLFIRRFG